MNPKQVAALTLTFALLWGQSSLAYPREGETCLQNQLAFLGYDPGPVDGFIGPQTRDAAQAWYNAQTGQEPTRFPELTRITALQWCREVGMMTHQVRKFWPSENEVRFLADAPATDVKSRLLEEYMGHVRGYFTREHNVWLAGSYDVIGAENLQNMTELLDRQIQVRSQNLRFSNALDDVFCAQDGVSGFAYPNTLGICLTAWNPGDTAASYQTQNVTAIIAAAHEYMHLIQRELSNNHHPENYQSSSMRAAFGPEWLIEGSAMYFMDGFLSDFIDRQMPTFSDLFEKVNGLRVPLGDLRANGTVRTPAQYNLSNLAAHVLVEEFGTQSQFDYWRAVGKLKDQNAAFVATFGISLDAFEAEFYSLLEGFEKNQLEPDE